MPGPARSSRSAKAKSSVYDGRPWLAAYPPDVPADYDIPAVPVTRLLDDAAASFPGTAALAFLGATMTYRELKDAVDKFAGALAKLGVGRGDRVALVLPNCPQDVIAFFAVLRLGAVAVQTNPLYTEQEMRHQLDDAGAKVAVCLDRTYSTVAAVQRDAGVQTIVVTSLVDYLPALRRNMLRLPTPSMRARRAQLTTEVPKDVPRFPALLRAAAPHPQVDVSPDDVAVLQYTGGTTGASKGAMLTHRNLVANAYQTRLWLPDATVGREVTLAVLPLFHSYGLTLCLLTTVLLAGKLVLLPRFDLDLVFEAIDEHRPTLFPGVPPIYKTIVDSPKARRHDLRSIRACLSGAMKLPTETQEQFERITGGRLVEGYGMTETSPATHANPMQGTRKPGSIGVPLPGTRAKIVDQGNAGREVPPGEPGELAICGPQVFGGYWQQEDLPGVFTDDGYLLTGDIAVMDEDGFFFIVDRKKDLIIAGGFNIYPNEIEDVLFKLPAVADCAVIGVPDRYRGETVKAFVVVQPGAELTEEQVRAHCASQLTAYKVPKLVEFRESLPRTAVGKALRRVLVEEEREKAAGQPAVSMRTSPRPEPEPEAPPAKKTAKPAPARKAPATKSAPVGKTATKKAAPAKKAAAKKAAPRKTTGKNDAP